MHTLICPAGVSKGIVTVKNYSVKQWRRLAWPRAELSGCYVAVSLKLNYYWLDGPDIRTSFTDTVPKVESPGKDMSKYTLSSESYNPLPLVSKTLRQA